MLEGKEKEKDEVESGLKPAASRSAGGHVTTSPQGQLVHMYCLPECGVGLYHYYKMCTSEQSSFPSIS